MRENRYSNQRSGQKQYHKKDRARGFSAVFGIGGSGGGACKGLSCGR